MICVRRRKPRGRRCAPSLPNDGRRPLTRRLNATSDQPDVIGASRSSRLPFIVVPILRPMLTRRTFLQLMGASTGVALTGAEYLSATAAQAATARFPDGSNGIQHVVILMMENRSFDHFLSWLPGAEGRHNMTFLSPDGNVYPNYPLAPDFQGCGYSDPDHSWEGFLIQHNFGKMDGFLQRPTPPANNPGVTLAAANTFPIGYYSNLDAD